jgi:hypothetical protein
VADLERSAKMSTESHKRYLEQRALREAQKAIDRGGRDGFGGGDFARLRIQTVEPWKRVVLGGTGFLFGSVGIYALKESADWIAVIFLVLGASCLLASIFGRKQTVEAALDGIDLTYLLDALF